MTLYHERRNMNKIKFYDASMNRGGFQAIGNRIKELFEEIEGPITCTESNDELRLKLKQAFGFTLTKPQEDIKWNMEQDASMQGCKYGRHEKRALGR